MAAFTRRTITHWIAPAGGAGAGLATATIVLLTPTGVLEDLVWRSGIAAVLPVAAPPLGTTARTLLALGGGTLAAAVGWAALFLLAGPGGFVDLGKLDFGKVVLGAIALPRFRRAAKPVNGVPTIRRADAHPDNPARRPLSASDLGAPMPPVAPPERIRPIPADLDQPLAAFHPAAVPAAPREPVRPVAPLRPAVALTTGERIDTVELPRAPVNDRDAPSIDALLRRLEQGTRRRVATR